MHAFRALAVAGGCIALTSCAPHVARTSDAAGSRTATIGLPARDSILIWGILTAEDLRDSTDGALADGRAHAQPVIRMLATRAMGRIRDARFAERDSLPSLPAPPVWPEPAWKERYRALAAARTDCEALRIAMTDPAPAVRLRATDLLPATCAGEERLATTLRGWIDGLPPVATPRAQGAPSWHLAAHAIVALARLRPNEARQRIATLSTHPQWQVRMYTARASATLTDTARLRVFARDTDDNVKEVAIEELAKLTGHTDDSLYIATLNAEGAQAVRAAAIALKGSPHPEAARAANAAFDRMLARDNDSARDARLALLEVAGRPPSDVRGTPPPAWDPTRVAPPRLAPQRAIALALGADVRVRVTMSPNTGGGSFVVRLRGDVAPVMAARVLELVNAKYYDGLTWHRVEHDFVIQGGSPGANEYVGYKDFIRDELGTVPHARGTIGMSTRGHDTGDAQWFINLRDNLRLGRDYTVFAEVVEGMDVVDDIMEGDVIARIEEVGRR